MQELRLVPVRGGIRDGRVEVLAELEKSGAPMEVSAGSLDEEGLSIEGKDAACHGDLHFLLLEHEMPRFSVL